ncbi:helix-turn-helix domain-containing protein [Fictibacillus sp. JL2B1089]|uniref:helix-turn-helix domain-containing protein n=1 Tax=Fictibacillus sp. JL2B1089 TaxID=3399565 RepID=UPI003A8618B0
MLGERLSNLRKNKGLSQYELADRLGFSRGKLANYEQGSRQPDYDTLQKIADYFEVSTDYLLGREDLTQKNEKKEIENENLFFFDLEGLSEEDIEAVRKHIESLRLMAKQYNKNFKKDN